MVREDTKPSPKRSFASSMVVEDKSAMAKASINPSSSAASPYAGFNSRSTTSGYPYNVMKHKSGDFTDGLLDAEILPALQTISLDSQQVFHPNGTANAPEAARSLTHLATGTPPCVHHSGAASVTTQPSLMHSQVKVHESQRSKGAILMAQLATLGFSRLELSITNLLNVGIPLGAITVVKITEDHDATQPSQQVIADFVVCTTFGGTNLLLISADCSLSIGGVLSVGHLILGSKMLLFLPQLSNDLTKKLNRRQNMKDEEQRDIFQPSVIFRSGIGRLPGELVLHLLEIILVAPGGVIDLRLHENEITVTHSCGQYLRPAILATNKYFKELGTPLLYARNRISLARDLLPDPVKTAEFFAEHHFAFDDSPLNGGTYIRRAELIKSLELRDTLFSHPGFDLVGSTPPSFTDNHASHIAWLFATLRRIEPFNFKLKELTITLNENDPKLALLLEYESRMRRLSNFSPYELAARDQGWKDLWSDNWITEPYPHNNIEPNWADRGMTITKWFINGTSPFAPNNKSRIPNPLIKLIKAWARHTAMIYGEIKFTAPVGGFDESKAVELSPEEVFATRADHWTW